MASRSYRSASVTALHVEIANALGERARQLPMPTVDVMVAVVEDDVAMRKSIERLLQASGFDTTAFACGQEFLDSGAATKINALVLDIHLEGMSGLEVQRRLLASGSKFPVIFITAYDDEATREQALLLGCAGYLHKPFEAYQLTEALQRGLLL